MATAESAIAVVLASLPPGRIASADDFDATPFLDGHLVGPTTKPHGGNTWLVLHDQATEITGPEIDVDAAYDRLTRNEGPEAD